MLNSNPIIIIFNYQTGDKFAFVNTHSNQGKKDYVPITYNLPFDVRPRMGYDKDVIETKEDFIQFMLATDVKEIKLEEI